MKELSELKFKLSEKEIEANKKFTEANSSVFFLSFLIKKITKKKKKVHTKSIPSCKS